MIHTSASRIQYIADGTTVEFRFSFPIFEASDLEVLVDDSEQTDGFVIRSASNSEGGTVVFSQAPAASAVVRLQRRLPIERTTDFQPNAGLVATALNEEFDRLVAMLQQVDDDVSRAVRVSATEADANMLLPAREARAGRILAFDQAGNVTTSSATLPELPDLDAIPEGVNNKHFTSSEKAKLATVQPDSEANPPQVTTQEKETGSELGLRSFAPRDVAEMARKHAPLGSVFGRTGAVAAQAGDYTADQIIDTVSKVIMTAAERAKLAGFVSVREFGAVGNGVNDDTAAFVCAAAYAVQNRTALRVPAGTYLLKKSIAFANAPVAVLGDGIGLSILKWSADATSLGISITGNSTEHSHLIRDLSFLVGKKGGTALNLDYTGEVDTKSSPGKALTMDRTSPRFLVENCFFAGAADAWTTGWDCGVLAMAAVGGTIINCTFTGWLGGNRPAIVPGSPTAFFMRGTNDTYENGHPVQFLLLNCTVYYASNAAVFNNCEGCFVHACNFVQVYTGIYFLSSAGPGHPQLNVANSHVNAVYAGVVAKHCVDGSITGSLFYGSDQATQGMFGVLLDASPSLSGCFYFSVLGNTFVNCSSTHSFTGIFVNQGDHVIIDNNVFRSATTAIQLSAGATNCKVNNGNIFAPSPAVATKVLNQGANNSVTL